MTENRKDIFDRIMEWKIFLPFNSIYHKYKEILLYLFFGGLTFVVSMLSYSVCVVSFTMEALIANVISWILAVLFAYITNRTWVFADKAHGIKEICRECLSFFGGRLATFGMEEVILLVFIDLLAWNKIGVKAAAQVLVIVTNYIISKLLVFRTKPRL